MSGKIVIYTAIYGGCDVIADPQVDIKDAKLVCFTDNKNLQSAAWEIVCTNRSTQDSNREAKLYKVKPYEFFPEYQYSLWVDGSVILKKNPVELVKKVLQSSNCAVLFHPKRPTVYQEFQRCLDRKLDPNEILSVQAQRYRRDGLPLDTPVYQLGIWARKHNHHEVITLGEALWNEISLGSKRDQVAFPYIIWKYGIQVSMITPELSDGTFKIRTHERDTTYDRRTDGTF